jgi:uncharacterized membrane protein
MTDVKAEWILWVALMVTTSVAFHIFSRYARDGMDIFPFALIVNGSALAACVLLYFIFHKPGIELPGNNGILFAVLAGVSIGVANFAAFGVYKTGMPVSIAVPLTRTAVAMGAVVLGIILFSETLTLVNVAGIGLSLVSIYLMTL